MKEIVDLYAGYYGYALGCCVTIRTFIKWLALSGLCAALTGCGSSLPHVSERYAGEIVPAQDLVCVTP